MSTRGGGPIASPQLVRDQLDVAKGAVSSGQWQVPVLEFDADLALAPLSEADTEGAVWGASLTHLSELSRFAADPVARGRLLPGVIVDAPRAVWRPVLTAADAAWAEALDYLVDAAARAALGPVPTHDRPGGRSGHPCLAERTDRHRPGVRRPDPAGSPLFAEALTQWQRDAVAGAGGRADDPHRIMAGFVGPAARLAG